MAVVAGGLVTSLLPVGLEYAFKGEVSSTKRAIVASAAAGVTGALATAAGKYLAERGVTARQTEPAPL